MDIDLELFKKLFPEWKHCDDELLGLWADMADCLVCVPEQCGSIAAKIPLLTLAHLLTVNGISCAEAAGETDDNGGLVCDCDDDYLNQIFAMGGKISSVTVDGIATSFDNSASNSLVTAVAGTSPFRAWLSTTSHGRMLVALLSRAGRGPRIAVSGGPSRAHFAEPILIHGRFTGHA